MRSEFINIIFNTFFLNLLTSQNFLFPKLLLLLILILILKKEIKTIIYDWRLTLGKNNPSKFFYLYKIKNFYFIWFWISIYFLIFIFFFFSFRLYRMGYTLDLNFIKNNYLSLYSAGEYLLIIIFTFFVLVIILSILLLLKKIKTFMETYLLQQHLYLINYKTEKRFSSSVDVLYEPIVEIMGYTEEEKKQKKDKYLKNGLYRKMFYYFYFFSYNTLIGFIMEVDSKIYKKFLKKTFLKNSEIINFSKHFKIILDTRYNILLPLLISLYELIFCDFKITYLFYFLPFYFLYTLWYKLSRFWYLDRTPYMDIILYEMYYDYPNILYADLDQEEFDTIFKYILGGLNQMRDYDVNASSTCYKIIHYKRYVLYYEEMYINENTGNIISRSEYEKMHKPTNKTEESKENE